VSAKHAKWYNVIVTTAHTDQKTDREVFMSELSELVNRKPATIRHWHRTGVLPKELLPQKNSRGWRYWTPKQAEGIKTWLRKTDRRPGRGLPHYQPDEQQIARHLEGQRAPRKRRHEEEATA
jgi:DNA-binding transcriptional MerR regulator